MVIWAPPRAKNWLRWTGWLCWFVPHRPRYLRNVVIGYPPELVGLFRCERCGHLSEGLAVYGRRIS